MNLTGNWMDKYLVAAVVAAALACAAPAAAQKAFPQAEGFGAASTGGRGGDVYHVTSLSDSSTTPGTLRYGIENAPDTGRTIVFDVGGWIDLNSKLGIVKEKHNITIAGQTAPGGGIGVRGDQFSNGADDVIIRHMRFRPGKSAGRVDSLSVSTGNNVIFDHISAGFSYDENASANGTERHAVSNLTIQHSSVSFGLLDHSAGSLIQNADNLSYHHNLYAHNHTRNPKARVEGDGLDWVNNVVYDYGNPFIAGDSSTTDYFWTTNFAGNYFITGPGDTNSAIITSGHDYNYGLYFGTNAVDNDGDSVHDGVEYTRSSRTLGNILSGTYTWAADPYGPFDIWRDESPQAAYERVLSQFGATPWQRDEVDQLLHDNVVNRTGGQIERESDLSGISNGGFGTLAAGTAPTDTDQDGMPDEWETKHGTAIDVASNNDDFDVDGYTDLEEYLNELAAFKAIGPLEFGDTGSGRYADWANWTHDWEPSRLDEVHVNSGAAVVDAVGQKAGTLKVAVGAGDTATLQITSGWLEVTDELVVGVDGAGTVQHSGGTVRAKGSGVTIAGGTYNLAGGVLTAPLVTIGAGGELQFTSGMLNVDMIDGDLVVDGGSIVPGQSPGTTHVTGDATFNGGGLSMEIFGTGDGEYDTFVVDGTLHAGGSLRFSILGGFSPQAGDRFDLLDFGAIDGTFSVRLPRLSGDLWWDTSWFYSTGVLVVRGVPEPAAGLLLGLAGTGMLAFRRRQGR